MLYTDSLIKTLFSMRSSERIANLKIAPTSPALTPKTKYIVPMSLWFVLCIHRLGLYKWDCIVYTFIIIEFTEFGLSLSSLIEQSNNNKRYFLLYYFIENTLFWLERSIKSFGDALILVWILR